MSTRVRSYSPYSLLVMCALCAQVACLDPEPEPDAQPDVPAADMMSSDMAPPGDMNAPQRDASIDMVDGQQDMADPVDMAEPVDLEMVEDMPVDMPTSGCDVEGDGTLESPVLLDGSLQAASCDDDVDWFGVALDPGCRLDVTLDQASADLTLELVRERGDRTLEPGVPSTSPSLSWTLPGQAEVVRVGVRAATTQTQTYTIDTQITCPTTPLTCEGGVDDLFEDNNDHSSGDNPAVIAPGDAWTASMCAAGANPFERYDYYTIEDEDRYQGCIISSHLSWPVTSQVEQERTPRRNWYRNNESLGLEHALGDEFGTVAPYQEVLRATWRLGDIKDDLVGLKDAPSPLIIPELDPNRYLDPELDFDPALTHWAYPRATAWLYDVDYHVRVSNDSYNQDGTAVIPEYGVEVKALCDFSCAPRPGDEFFGITEGDDWFDAYRGLRGGLDPDVALEQGGRLGGLARGIICESSAYNGYVDNGQFIEFERDIDQVNATAFGKGYVNGQLVGNDACTATLRVSWEGAQKPWIAWSTTSGNISEEVWTYDADVSQVNDASNPFFVHSSPATAFSSKGWQQPPSVFGWREEANHVELYATPELFNAPSATTVVQVALANPPGQPDGISWSVRYGCAEDF